MSYLRGVTPARIGDALRTRPGRVLAGAVAAGLVVSLVALALVPGAAPPRGRHRTTGTAPDAGGSTGVTTEVASPPAPVPDTAVTVLPAPVAAPPVPAGSHPAPTAPTTSRPAPSYPAPRPEANRSAPAPPPAPPPGAVTAGDFPDPAVLRVGAVYYAYSTEVGATAVPVLRSVDLVHWESAGNALANLPAWSGGASVWAPSVVATASGYVLFYSTRDNRTGDQCISRAVSLLPEGPFVDTSANPFACQLGLGGSIDPDPFVDANGAQWLMWKSQGTASGTPPHIWAQAVGGDWKFLVGQPVALLGPDQQWEAGVVEAPAMFRAGSRYYLLYSGNNWNTAAYGVGYAVCRTASGPCVKPRPGPALATHGNEAGPGSPAVFVDALGHTRIVFHAWAKPHVGYPGGERSLHLGTVSVSGNALAISEP
jgi:hypothetical protein